MWPLPIYNSNVNSNIPSFEIQMKFALIPSTCYRADPCHSNFFSWDSGGKGSSKLEEFPYSLVALYTVFCFQGHCLVIPLALPISMTPWHFRDRAQTLILNAPKATLTSYKNFLKFCAERFYNLQVNHFILFPDALIPHFWVFSAWSLSLWKFNPLSFIM